MTPYQLLHDRAVAVISSVRTCILEAAIAPFVPKHALVMISEMLDLGTYDKKGVKCYNWCLVPL